MKAGGWVLAAVASVLSPRAASILIAPLDTMYDFCSANETETYRCGLEADPPCVCPNGLCCSR